MNWILWIMLFNHKLFSKLPNGLHAVGPVPYIHAVIQQNLQLTEITTKITYN